MLYNSFGFIFLFLPITLTLYFLLGRWVAGRAATFCLVIASIFFYGGELNASIQRWREGEAPATPAAAAE